jgi:DNA-binding NarL/FixJ family response regulator
MWPSAGQGHGEALQCRALRTLRILIADDHTLVRAGIRSIIERMFGVAVVAEAPDGAEALRLIGQRRPDIALVDILMPEMNGLEVAARAIAEHPATRVILLSMHFDTAYVDRALRMGAAGYVLKSAEPAELELAIRAVGRGDVWFTPSVSRKVAQSHRGLASAESPFDTLTPRQREILQLIAEGRTTKEIAVRLGLSVKTIETHRTALMDRLDIHGVAGLVRYAIRNGIVQSP